MAMINIKRDDKTEVTFFAAVERFIHSRTTSVVTEHGGITYILYEGGGATYYKKNSRRRRHAEWVEVTEPEVSGELVVEPLES